MPCPRPHVLWAVGEEAVGGPPRTDSGFSGARSQPSLGLWLTPREGLCVGQGAYVGTSVYPLGYFHVRPAGYILGISEHWGDAKNLEIFEL